MEPTDHGEETEHPGIYSKVHARVEIDPETAYLSITLRMTVRNQTNESVQPRVYILPPIRHVRDLSAKDAAGDLDVFHSVLHAGVRWLPSTKKIAPGGEYWWEVSFECPGRFQRLGNRIAGPYPVRVQDKFSGVPVSVHEFLYEFIFPKPKPRWKWPVRTVNIMQVNNQNLRCKVQRRWTHSRCTMEFILRGGKELKLFLATNYEFSSVLAMVVTIVTTIALTQYGPSVVAALIGVVRGWLG